MIKKTYIYQKDRFFARNNELTSIDCNERVEGQRYEAIAERDLFLYE